jgi:hypothetical protein
MRRAGVAIKGISRIGKRFHHAIARACSHGKSYIDKKEEDA